MHSLQPERGVGTHRVVELVGEELAAHVHPQEILLRGGQVPRGVRARGVEVGSQVGQHQVPRAVLRLEQVTVEEDGEVGHPRQPGDGSVARRLQDLRGHRGLGGPLSPGVCGRRPGLEEPGATGGGGDVALLLLFSVRQRWSVAAAYGSPGAPEDLWSTPASGQDRNGGAVGGPWELNPKASVFHVTLCLIPLHVHRWTGDTR